MTNRTCSLVKLTLFNNSSESFLAALDEAKVHHSPTHMFSTTPKASGIAEAITALSDAMPWNAIAKVIVAWIEARNSREVIIYTEAGEKIHTRGYSASEVQKLLQESINVVVIDMNPAESKGSV